MRETPSSNQADEREGLVIAEKFFIYGATLAALVLATSVAVFLLL